MRWTRGLAVGLALGLTGCASSPGRRAEPAPDRTRDPEFEAAREAARAEFETQAEALAAGVYEPFVHPDSVAAGKGEALALREAEPTTPRERGDPSTDELLGTLGADFQYNQGREPVTRVDAVGPADPARAGAWTLQMGAFGSETGALVRQRELERRFPDMPLRHARGEDGLYRVYLGRFRDQPAAEQAREQVARQGYPDAWATRAP